jgi:energy-coupling factor transport system permease protein
MNARAVVAWSAAGISIVILTNNPVYRTLVLLAALNFLLAHKRSDARLQPFLVLLGASTLISIAVSFFLSHVGNHAVVLLPLQVPLVGGRLTMESAIFGASAGIGIAAGALMVASFSMVLDSHELVEALPAPLHRTGTTLAAALNLVPSIGHSVTAVREAQTMRGWRPRGPRSYADILVPVTLTALENSIQLAESMEARAYGSGPRTHMSSLAWTAGDRLISLVALTATAAFIAGRVTGQVVDWYPYPTPELPRVAPLMVAACALLALPVLVRRRD